jgi:hypothetical protein
VGNLIVNSLRYVNVNGREFAVAKIRILQPQVLEGSKGKLYYPPEEIEKDYERWNGMPMVVYHPNKDGKNISARDPWVMERQEIGRIYNAKLTDNYELDVEGWFDVELTKKIDDRVWKSLQDGKHIEISTGLYTKDEPAPNNSKYKDKEYTHVARNYRPDHLAILPDQVGACSVKDGCGVFNQETGLTFNSVSGILQVNSHVADEVLARMINEFTEQSKADPTINPSWVKDHDKWEKAKQAAAKEGQPDNYALITEIYKRMGGAINNTFDSSKDTSDTNTNTETNMGINRGQSVEWLVANCDCYKKTNGAKDVLLKMTVDQYAEVFTNNAKEAIENEDSKFFDWMNNASDDIKGAFVKMIKNKIMRQTGNEFLPPDKKKPDDTQPDPNNPNPTPNPDMMSEEEKKKKMMMDKQAATNQSHQMTEQQYIASLPPSLQEVLNNAKQVTEREKQRLVNALTQHITDNTQKQNAQKVLMGKTLPDLQERVALMPPVPQSQQQANNNYQPPVGVANDFYSANPDYLGASGYPTGNSGGYDVANDILEQGPTFNWAEMAKNNK